MTNTHTGFRTEIAFVGTAILLSMLGLTAGVASAAGNAAVTMSTVHAFPDGPVVPGGTSTLIRNNAGVTATFLTPDLTAGEVYTVWWVIFNQPENCTGGVCDLGDVTPFPGNTAAGVSLVYGGGQLIARSSRGDFGTHLAVGDASGAMFGPGLTNPLGAVIHIILRTHGPALPEMLDDQLTTFAGGCEINTCANEVTAIHEPNSDQNSKDIQAIRSLLERVAERQGIRP